MANVYNIMSNKIFMKSLILKIYNSHFSYMLLLFLFFASFLIGSSTSSQYPIQSESSPKFLLDVCFYQGAEKHTQLEFYYSVPSSELLFNASNNNYVASISILLKVTNSDNKVILSKSKEKKIGVNSVKETENTRIGVIDQIVIDLLPGEYNLEVEVTDQNSNLVSTISSLLKVPTFNSDLDISSIQLASLISPEKTNNSFVKGNKMVIPNPSKKYNYNSSSLFIYYEIYNLAISDKDSKSVFESSLLIVNQFGDSLIYIPTQTFTLSSTSCIQTKTLDIRKLNPGNYWVSVSVFDIVSSKYKIEKSKFTVHNSLIEEDLLPMADEDIKKYRDQIKYFATRNELELFDKVNNVGKRSFLINFWQRKDTSPETEENEFMLNCFARIDYSDKTFKDGLNSDMGRVFIIYGQPDEIENQAMNMNTKPYIIWEYFSTGTGKQQFIFVDTNGNHIYRLVHSTVETEIKNPNWMKE